MAALGEVAADLGITAALNLSPGLVVVKGYIGGGGIWYVHGRPALAAFGYEFGAAPGETTRATSTAFALAQIHEMPIVFINPQVGQ